jgi:hypothetical protein
VVPTSGGITVGEIFSVGVNPNGGGHAGVCGSGMSSVGGNPNVGGNPGIGGNPEADPGTGVRVAREEAETEADRESDTVEDPEGDTVEDPEGNAVEEPEGSAVEEPEGDGGPAAGEGEEAAEVGTGTPAKKLIRCRPSTVTVWIRSEK